MKFLKAVGGQLLETECWIRWAFCLIQLEFSYTLVSLSYLPNNNWRHTCWMLVLCIFHSIYTHLAKSCREQSSGFPEASRLSLCLQWLNSCLPRMVLQRVNLWAELILNQPLACESQGEKQWEVKGCCTFTTSADFRDPWVVLSSILRRQAASSVMFKDCALQGHSKQAQVQQLQTKRPAWCSTLLWVTISCTSFPDFFLGGICLLLWLILLLACFFK